jgi:hypothetical protein
MANKPTEKSSELDIDKFNQAMRASPEYQAFLRQEGLVDSGRGVKMNKDQRKRLAASMGGLPEGMEIDGGGNVDTKGFNWKKWGPMIAAGAAMAIPGVGPAVLAGLKAAGTGVAAGVGKAASAVGSAASAATGGGAGAGAGGGLGGWAGLADIAGKGLGAISQAQASNRGARAAGQLDYDQNVIAAEREYNSALNDRQREDRDERGDAWRRLQQAEYVLNRQAGTAPGYLADTPYYKTGTKATTEGERQGAEGLKREVMLRLMEGSQLPDVQRAAITPRDEFNKNLKPSAWETIAGYAQPVLQGLEQLPGRGRGPMTELPDYLDPDYDWRQ